MKRLIVFFLLIAFFFISCNKDNPSIIRGTWLVMSIQTQTLKSNTDSGWQEQKCISPLFFEGESLTIQKEDIVPCPSADDLFNDYEDYKGTVSYTFAKEKLSIPELVYTKSTPIVDGLSVSSVGTNAMTFDIDVDGRDMNLTGSVSETDNLGNVKKRTNIRVSLHR